MQRLTCACYLHDRSCLAVLSIMIIPSLLSRVLAVLGINSVRRPNPCASYNPSKINPFVCNWIKCDFLRTPSQMAHRAHAPETHQCRAI